MDNIYTEPISKLLGLFLIDRAGSCLILDWYYAKNYFHFDEDDEHHILSAINEDEYKQIGTSFDMEETSEFDIPDDSEIPVFLNYDENGIATNISIEIGLWISSLETKQQRGEALQVKIDELVKTEKKLLTQKSLGSVTTHGGAILICDLDIVRLCYDYGIGDDEETQLYIPPEGDGKGFNAGIYYEMEGLWRIPVYGHYEDDKIKKVTINLNEAIDIEDEPFRLKKN